jgi:hypothetical protein
MYMTVDIKKIYVETRFKTGESKSDSDFSIELPRTFNVPENCVCYIDDFVIPVSWSTIDGRNNKLYLKLTTNYTELWYKVITLPSMNYTGAKFVIALEEKIKEAIESIPLANVAFQVTFDQNDNLIKIAQLSGSYCQLTLVSGADLAAGKNWSARVPKILIQSMNGVLRIGKASFEITENTPYVAYLDLFTTRNLYLTSSALASYSNISNFDNDVIIKKIPISASFGNMMFYNGTTGYDFLDVSKRSLTRIDFRLQDSYGNGVDLRGNHWSFSLVFQIK